MQAGKTNPFLNYLFPSVAAAIAFTAVIGLTTSNLSGFQIVGKLELPFTYASNRNHE